MGVCVSEREIRRVNLLRLQQAHVFISLPQVTKMELTVPALMLMWTILSGDSKDVGFVCRVRLLQEVISLRQDIL